MTTIPTGQEPWIQIPTKPEDGYSMLPLINVSQVKVLEKAVRQATEKTGWTLWGFIPGKGLVAVREGRAFSNWRGQLVSSRTLHVFDPATMERLERIEETRPVGHHCRPDGMVGLVRCEWRKYLLPKDGRTFYADRPSGVSVTVVEGGKFASASTTPVTVYDALAKLAPTQDVERAVSP